MRSLSSIAATAACCLIIGLCAAAMGVQVIGITRRLVRWEQRQEPIPAFGQADVVYFSEPTCPACQMASPTILDLRRRYPHYRIARVDTSTSEGIALQEEYNRAYHVSTSERGKIPAAFAGRRYFIGAAAIRSDLPACLQAGPLDRPGLQPRQRGRDILAQRFRSLGAAPVLVAGLVDSINPCAIASLIFFLSYLTLGGRRPRDLLWIGGLFTLGAFLTYFLIGLGLLRALHSLRAMPVLARGLYPVAAVVTLTLAGISFLDYRRARRGDTTGIALQLPRGVKLRIHQVIRTQRRMNHLAIAAFVTAVLVSGLQFVCTSQIYLPTLMYMAQTGQGRPRAISLLLLYNLMFVLPLIVLFLAAYLGVSTKTMAKLAARHVATTKLVAHHRDFEEPSRAQSKAVHIPQNHRGVLLAISFLFLGFTVYLSMISMRMFVPG